MKVNKGPCTKKHGDDYFDHLPAVNQRFWQGPQLYDILLGFACSVPGKVNKTYSPKWFSWLHGDDLSWDHNPEKIPPKNKSKVTF